MCVFKNLQGHNKLLTSHSARDISDMSVELIIVQLDGITILIRELVENCKSVLYIYIYIYAEGTLRQVTIEIDSTSYDEYSEKILVLFTHTKQKRHIYIYIYIQAKIWRANVLIYNIKNRQRYFFALQIPPPHSF